MYLSGIGFFSKLITGSSDQVTVILGSYPFSKVYNAKNHLEDIVGCLSQQTFSPLVSKHYPQDTVLSMSIKL